MNTIVCCDEWLIIIPDLDMVRYAVQIAKDVPDIKAAQSYETITYK